MWNRNHVTPRFLSYFAYHQKVIIALMIALTVVAFSIPKFQSQKAVAAGLPLGEWGTYSQSFILKDKKISFSFNYPKGWEVIAHPDGFVVHVQNVAPFDNPANVSGGLPEGFVKISFMLDPKANPAKPLSGEDVSINGVLWKQTLATGDLAGDRSMTLEMVRDGVVFRIYTYIVGTGGERVLFERHVATLDKVIVSLTFESTVPLERPPDAPPVPAEGKPKVP
ncbi:MAG: hypothetical protein COW33_02770 [Anaerolineae bacterium CG17_big_fil_post_rev_8_21_14_2_50_57_27]|nr:MAG: hypothetical protein COW33_02770 [Anaerolineae bacterium CG17_big_fil_post_rev_8_21_14_2_50_57_27]PJH75592.1 MAG: hypothetical protein CO064_05820 [Anaerolineae bacterium CG_4_9_14_0_8_um_filter_58_9]